MLAHTTTRREDSLRTLLREYLLALHRGDEATARLMEQTRLARSHHRVTMVLPLAHGAGTPRVRPPTSSG
jgi:hypothetical protein